MIVTDMFAKFARRMSATKVQARMAGVLKDVLPQGIARSAVPI
jgi:hypothetical protein